MLTEVGSHVEGEKAICEVGLAEPAARCAVGQRVVDALVADLVPRQVLVEVAREIEYEAGLAAVLDDDVQRLEAIVVVLLAELGEGSEVAVVAEALLDEDALACDGRRVLVANRGRVGQQLRVDAAAQK